MSLQTQPTPAVERIDSGIECEWFPPGARAAELEACASHFQCWACHAVPLLTLALQKAIIPHPSAHGGWEVIELGALSFRAKFRLGVRTPRWPRIWGCGRTSSSFA
eukprot:5942593-Amphidinium_carterae.1